MCAAGPRTAPRARADRAAWVIPVIAAASCLIRQLSPAPIAAGLEDSLQLLADGSRRYPAPPDPCWRRWPGVMPC